MDNRRHGRLFPWLYLGIGILWVLVTVLSWRLSPDELVKNYVFTAIGVAYIVLVLIYLWQKRRPSDAAIAKAEEKLDRR